MSGRHSDPAHRSIILAMLASYSTLTAGFVLAGLMLSGAIWI